MMEKKENDEMDDSWWKLEAQKIQDNSGSCFYKVLAVVLWVAGALFLLSSITFKQHANVTGLLTVATGIYVWKGDDSDGFYMKSLTAIFTFGMVVSGLIFSIVALYE